MGSILSHHPTFARISIHNVEVPPQNFDIDSWLIFPLVFRLRCCALSLASLIVSRIALVHCDHARVCTYFRRSTIRVCACVCPTVGIEFASRWCKKKWSLLLQWCFYLLQSVQCSRLQTALFHQWLTRCKTSSQLLTSRPRVCFFFRGWFSEVAR